MSESETSAELPVPYEPEIILTDGDKGTIEDLKRFPRGGIIFLKVKRSASDVAAEERLDELLSVGPWMDSKIYYHFHARNFYNAYVFDNYRLDDKRLVSITLVATPNSAAARLLRSQLSHIAKLKLRLETIKENFLRFGKNMGILDYF